ncbi:DUF1120 domain-containing protein [Enterobacter cloacae]|uniref:DUF1120 domain-containing protein n=1 Tax=Enterobacter cloacae TaxID=550 RepID=UPI000BA0ECD0|nr:DUF1120 domain-containing protein [Enterobacter cloacae]OZU91358.1 hypothetical protein CIW67_19580 [Enterobacter cloacae]PAN81082.1 hypothetical protein CIW66_19920 [Enterobacter cloacae]PAN94175.1 hypothetical protein CIW63_19780 [Enterobacter cloacae]HAS1027787.1 DUF1120 domain-containing protein [Enterobacter cloacae]HAS1036728.1 DUF1120 domain-containing protein [Enterobacter cloacae]
MNALLKKGLVISVLAMSVNVAVAAESIDIKVTGKIVPTSCTPAFASGGGIADYGTIKAVSLDSTTPTPLADIKTIPITITCEEATRVGIKFTDIRDSSSPDDTLPETFVSTDFAITPAFTFGLGMYNGVKIGAYALGIDKGLGKATNGAGTTLYPMGSKDNGASWFTRGVGYMQISSDNSEIFTFAESKTTGLPSPETKFNFNVGVAAMINPTNDLKITDEVVLDGLTTVELVYL